MKLSTLLSDYSQISPEQDCEVSSLCLSSRDSSPGALFFAYPGEKVDGRAYIAEAIEKGAVAIVLESRDAPSQSVLNSLENSVSVVWCYVENLQQKVGPIAQKFYHHPSQDMMLIAVTGTSGKTSVANIIAQYLLFFGKNAYIMGTLGVGKPQGPFLDTGINTPDPISLQRYFHALKEKGCDTVVMEVSSHALVQGRVQGLIFDVAIFTNLSQDHLDYHKTMKAYGEAKELLLIKNAVKHAVFNFDDAWSRDLYERYQHTAIDCHFFSRNQIIASIDKTELRGEFNQQNLSAAVTCLLTLGYDKKAILKHLSRVRSIPGRLDSVEREGWPRCVIDYAHKPDALEKVLLALRAMAPQKLFCVFGCGGDRDKGKRPLMAAIAERYSEVVCITDDNPRTELSEKILEEILAGFVNPEKVLVISNRAEAIRTIMALAGEHDIVLIAGKGHENYQIVGNEKKYFSDKEVVINYINEINRIK